MVKLLYYFRINAAFLIAFILYLPFLKDSEDLRSPASTNISKGLTLSSKIPEFKSRIEAVENKMFTLKAFTNDFKKHNKRLPTIREAIQKIIIGHHEIIRELKDIPQDDLEIKYYVFQTIDSLEFGLREQENIVAFKNKHQGLLEKPLTLKDEDLVNKLENLWKNPFGEYGKFIAAMNIPGVEAQNINLELNPKKGLSLKAHKHQLKISQAKMSRFEEIKNFSPDKWEDMTKRFPSIFSDERKNDIKAVISWLKNKEIDLIIKIGENKYLMLEVPNTNQIFTLEELERNINGNKSIIKQQLETKEIIDFLNLKDTYTPAISFLKGIENDAAEKLRAEGITVLDTKN